ADNLQDIIDILKSPEEAHCKIHSTAPQQCTHLQSASPQGFSQGSSQGSSQGFSQGSSQGATPDTGGLVENDFALIKGQAMAKMGMEIAAAGNHNIILIGAPGCGKTLLAKSLPTILPPLDKKEAIETSKIYSVAGLLQNQYGFIKERPFRAPHHTATVSSLTGGGSNGSPGEISLAHNGVLYLDEFCEFSRAAIEILRQPMEDGIIQISRVKNKYTYPANFMLVASMNPCPCGFYGSDDKKCRCSSTAISRYMAHLSGPILDRIDLQILLKPVKSHEIVAQFGLGNPAPESSATIAARVLEARMIQLKRFRNEGFYTNSRIPTNKLEQYCKIGTQEVKFIRHIMEKFNLSARSYVRLLKISRTIADLDGKDFISLAHISKALQFRNHLTINRYDH
ncbi:MAG: YifB family Mg chelatase-like AAA ATPase, partial [Bacteroidales bacterium]|nr:YifB family Mg chelatase-like AAA ATPase [Bacteroidales bacterium]